MITLDFVELGHVLGPAQFPIDFHGQTRRDFRPFDHNRFPVRPEEQKLIVIQISQLAQ